MKQRKENTQLNEHGRAVMANSKYLTQRLSQRFSNSEVRPSRGHDAVLEGARMTPWNRHTSTSFVDNVIISE